MLKKLQKVRDVLEEVTHVYVEVTVLGEALEEDGHLAFVSTMAAEIVTQINSMIYTDLGYIVYFDVHAKIMQLCSGIIKPYSPFIKDWLRELLEADYEALKDLALN